MGAEKRTSFKKFYSVFIPYMLICAILAFVIILIIYGTKSRQQRTEAERCAENTLKQIEIVLNNLFDETKTMEAFITASGEDNMQAILDADNGEIYKDEFDAFAEALMKKNEVIQAIQFQPAGKIYYTYPVKGNEAAIGGNVFEELNHLNDAYTSKDEGSTVVSGSVELIQGGNAIIARDPVYFSDGRFWGFSCILLKLPDALNAIGLDELSYSGYDYKLRTVDKDGTERVISVTATDDMPVDTYSGHFFDMDWYLSIIPRDGWMGVTDLFQYILAEILVVFLVSYLLAKNSIIEDEKEAAFRAVNEANAAKTEFLSNISHEISTPMNAIVGMVHTAIKNIDDKARVLECLAKVELSSDHLLSLINSVLDMNRLDTDKFEFPEETFDMEALIRDCITVVDHLALSSSVTIHPHIAAVRQFRYLCGSPMHVRQIFVNILTNGIKYNRQGGTLDIYCDNRAKGDDSCEYVFVFKDNGIGMSEDFLEKIFTPFSQEDPAARTNYTGSGLGLSISKMLIEKMGGTISVESMKGEGSTFTVMLPFKIDTGKSSEKPEEKLFANADITGCNVLLVEDNTLNMEIAVYALEEAGADVVCAADGKEAIEAFKNQSDKLPFDIILMDIMMPEMDGIEATRIIRGLDKSNAKTVPIVALTANAFPDDIKLCMDAGMDAHLAKPLNINEMIQTISELRS